MQWATKSVILIESPIFNTHFSMSKCLARKIMFCHINIVIRQSYCIFRWWSHLNWLWPWPSPVSIADKAKRLPVTCSLTRTKFCGARSGRLAAFRILRIHEDFAEILKFSQLVQKSQIYSLHPECHRVRLAFSWKNVWTVDTYIVSQLELQSSVPTSHLSGQSLPSRALVFLLFIPSSLTSYVWPFLSALCFIHPSPLCHLPSSLVPNIYFFPVFCFPFLRLIPLPCSSCFLPSAIGCLCSAWTLCLTFELWFSPLPSPGSAPCSEAGRAAVTLKKRSVRGQALKWPRWPLERRHLWPRAPRWWITSHPCSPETTRASGDMLCKFPTKATSHKL